MPHSQSRLRLARTLASIHSIAHTLVRRGAGRRFSNAIDDFRRRAALAFSYMPRIARNAPRTILFAALCTAALSQGALAAEANVESDTGAGNVAASASTPTSAPASASATPTTRNPLWATPVDPGRNLYRITPQLYRGEQPLASDAALIQSLGIRTIISLRAFHGDEGVLHIPGVKLIRIPINTWNIGDAQVVAALRAIQQAMTAGPVLIHCQHGADRTGTVSAMYRMVEQGWTREQALDELRHGGYGFHEIWFNIPHYLQTVDVRQIQQKLHEPPS